MVNDIFISCRSAVGVADHRRLREQHPLCQDGNQSVMINASGAHQIKFSFLAVDQLLPYLSGHCSQREWYSGLLFAPEMPPRSPKVKPCSSAIYYCN